MTDNNKQMGNVSMDNELTKENSTPIYVYHWNGQRWIIINEVTTIYCLIIAARNLGFVLKKVI